MRQRLKHFYETHQRWVPIAFFVLGFLFDAVMIGRVDHLLTLLQQAAYLVLSGLLIRLEIVETVAPFEPPALLRKVWKYREALLHFLMGTLLNLYTLFFFMSASALTPYLFIVLLVIVLILNEFKRFGKSQIQVHMAFWTLCLLSFMATLAPIVLGFIGAMAFLLSIAASVLVFWGFYRLMQHTLKDHPKLARTHMRLPFLGVTTVFVALYFFQAIPPVPLSVQYMGIFHDVKRQDDQFALYYTRSPWKFWQHGDQTFKARANDQIFCFARIFSPTRFKDNIQVRWLYHTERQGWQTSDVIPMAIVGGREEGFRGVTRKAAYQPGLWRVQVETQDGREIGRIRFRIEPDDSTEERTLRVRME